MDFWKEFIDFCSTTTAHGFLNFTRNDKSNRLLWGIFCLGKGANSSPNQLHLTEKRDKKMGYRGIKHLVGCVLFGIDGKKWLFTYHIGFTC